MTVIDEPTPRWKKHTAVVFVNIGLVYVKCMLLESRPDALKNTVGEVLG